VAYGHYSTHSTDSAVRHLMVYVWQIFSSHCKPGAVDRSFANFADQSHFYQFHGFTNLIFSCTSYKSSQATALRQRPISGALLQSLAEFAVATIPYQCWDNRCIFVPLFSISQICRSDASRPAPACLTNLPKQRFPGSCWSAVPSWYSWLNPCCYRPL
jgi:hypothetical protein